MNLTKGTCDFCGQPVWLNERAVYLKNDHLAHYECHEEATKSPEKEEPKP